MQTCPAFTYPPMAIASVACSISASSITITGQEDPSSNESFFTPVTDEMCAPVAVDPVNETLRTLESDTNESPRAAPDPVIT